MDADFVVVASIVVVGLLVGLVWVITLHKKFGGAEEITADDAEELDLDEEEPESEVPEKEQARARRVYCFKGGRRLEKLDVFGKVSVIDTSMFKVIQLTCEKCKIFFCSGCAGRKGLNAVCPKCKGDTTPPLVLPQGS